jgi:hypothetical protein
MRSALAAMLVTAALVTPFAACGGDDGDGGGTITDAGLWLDTYIAKLCTKAHACKADYVPQSTETFEDVWGADVAACKSGFLTAEQVRTSVSSGKTTFNAAAGAQCLAMLPYDGQACPDFWSTNDPEVCSTVFAGTVAAGGACSNGLECMSGLFCASGMCSAGAAPSGARSQLRGALDGF